jgi:hypothetical protein
MNLRKKYRAVILLWLVVGFALLIAAVNLSPYYLIGLLTIAIIVGVYVMRLRCPVCGKPALYKPVTIFGITMPFWISWIPERCSKCATPL